MLSRAVERYGLTKTQRVLLVSLILAVLLYMQQTWPPMAWTGKEWLGLAIAVLTWAVGKLAPQPGQY